MNIIRPDWPDAPANIGVLTTRRIGGVSSAPYDDGRGGGGLNLGDHVGDDPTHVLHNRAELRKWLPAEPVWLAQVHGTDVHQAASPASGRPCADASTTIQSNVVCAILSADCLPVLLSNVGGTVVGAAHAGWRGLAGGVLEHTVRTMQKQSAQEIVAWLGPAIGPQQFEVGSDVLAAFVARDEALASAFRLIPGKDGKYLANIYQLARAALHRAGVTRISGGESCTVTEKMQYFSYRRDGTTGRMASLIWIR